MDLDEMNSSLNMILLIIPLACAYNRLYTSRALQSLLILGKRYTREGVIGIVIANSGVSLSNLRC